VTLLAKYGNIDRTMTPDEVRQVVAEGVANVSLEGKRVLVIIPDSTRSAPIPLMFNVLYEQLAKQVKRLDYLIALGTHQPMSDDAIDKLVGVSKDERIEAYPKSHVFNHHWDDPEQLTTIGTIGEGEMHTLTGGLVARETPIAINKLIFDYDQLFICGPVFPHEVAGFSGGAKYLFPGIAGQAIIDSSHWLGALSTSMDTIGVMDTPVRRMLHRAAEFVDKPITCFKMVVTDNDLHGLYVGDVYSAWQEAATLSAQLHIHYVDTPFKRVLSMPSSKYDDLWTAAKAMYKTEPAIADGGEVIIYAPHLTEVSVTHGDLIKQVGYHVRDYFTKQWEQFRDVPWTILAHSTHVKGKGTFEDGIETPRIRVTLATSIPKEVCDAINLGFRDYRELDPERWRDREHEGTLLVENAGEQLYRLSSSTP
jgi:nickel-dependent lactate racemase